MEKTSHAVLRVFKQNQIQQTPQHQRKGQLKPLSSDERRVSKTKNNRPHHCTREEQKAPQMFSLVMRG